MNNPKIVNLDVAKSPPETVMRFLIASIHMMGAHMISDTAKSMSGDPKQYQTEYNNMLSEINTTAIKIDKTLDQVIDKENAQLGIVVLAILQIAIMAMSTYIDAAQETDPDAATEFTQADVENALSEMSVELDPLKDGVFIGGKGGDH